MASGKQGASLINGGPINGVRTFQSLETWGARWAKRELEKFGEPLLGEAAE